MELAFSSVMSLIRTLYALIYPHSGGIRQWSDDYRTAPITLGDIHAVVVSDSNITIHNKM